MQTSIPNLWRDEKDASRLYQIYLCRLQMNRLHERVVSACRQIRRYAARGPGSKEALFTFPFEIDSLCDLKNYKTAWRQLRFREQILFGKRFDLPNHQWSPEDGWALEFNYAPLLYFLGRHQQGCNLLEISLGFWFRSKKVSSYHLLFRVYNGENEPSHRCRVTLSHFYRHLGKALNTWQYWDAFVNGLHPRLFRVAEIRRAELLAEPAHLECFFGKLMDLRDELTTSGVGGSLSDLVDSPAKVRKRQEATKHKLDEFEEQTKPARERTDQKMQRLFPELLELPR